MTSNFNKYRIYCETESAWQYVWSATAPTECPVDSGHTVNASSVGLMRSVTRLRRLVAADSPSIISGHNFYVGDTTDGSISITLKQTVQSKNRVIIFTKVSAANTLSIYTDGIKTINVAGPSNPTEYQYDLVANGESVKIQYDADNNNWVVLPLSSSTGEKLLDGVLYNDVFEKGSMIVDNGVDFVSILGDDNKFLKADSTTATGVSFVTETVLGDSNVAANAGIDVSKLANGSVNNTKFQYLSSLGSNVQDQFDARIVGPASASDNAVVRYDATTGKLAQNSGVLIDDSNNVSGVLYLEINDISAPDNAGASKGRLYKKTGDPGIWWKPDAAGAEVDLTLGGGLTAAELAQLANIDTHTISNTQWGYLSGSNQGIASTDSVTFAGITSNGTLNMSSNYITNVLTPVNANDAANKQYVDSVAQGLSVKDSVRVATVVAGTLASSYANASVVDGITLATGNRILIKNQATGSENGIYVVNASGAPTRALDLQAGVHGAGVYTFVEEGTVNADSGWVCNTDSGTPDVVGTDAIAFVQFSGAGQIVDGDCLAKDGNRLDVKFDNTSIEMVSDQLHLISAPVAKGDLLTFSTVQAKLSVSGTKYHVLYEDSSEATGLKWGEVPLRTWVFKDQKSTATNGGSSIGDSTWYTRVLNTTVAYTAETDVSLTSNQLTFAAGTYQVSVTSVFNKTNDTKLRLYDITNSAVLDYSVNASVDSADKTNVNLRIDTCLQFAGSTVVEVQYACNNTQADDGLGVPSGISGAAEFYTVVKVQKM